MLLFKNKKRKSTQLIEVQLLPDKGQRDYVLRLVTFILILIAIMANVYFVYIPRIDLTKEIHDKKGSLYKLNLQYNESMQQLKAINQDLYDVNRNNDIITIEQENLDFYGVSADIENLQPPHSFIENMNFTNGGYTIVMTVQFDTYFDLTQFHKQLLDIDYITAADAGAISIIKVDDNPDNLNRVKTNFKLELDHELSPKAGGIYE